MSLIIVDSGGANLVSVMAAIERLGTPCKVSVNENDIRGATHVILPGVGSADKIMQRLSQLKLVDVLRSLRQPVLGICVGMQLLFEFSEEKETSCLGLIPGDVKRLQSDVLPQMGWNTLSIKKKNGLMKNISEGDYVYFVHSFAAPIMEASTAVTHYGTPFSASVQKDNFFGVQFHPERSGQVGAQILKNFLGQ